MNHIGKEPPHCFDSAVMTAMDNIAEGVGSKHNDPSQVKAYRTGLKQTDYGAY